MKIQHSLYELVGKKEIQSKNTYTSRQGALLRVEFEDGKVGYADCHPWKENGDLPLKTQLELLEQGKCTRLTARSVYFAKLDAQARHDKVNLLKDLKLVSHYTITKFDRDALDDAINAAKVGFTYFKIKMSKNLEEEELLLKELVKLNPLAKIRLDFNGKLSYDSFVNFLDHIADIKQNIDFVEDPFPYEYGQWTQIQNSYQIKLAADECYKQAFGNPESAKVLVMKPAVHSVKPFNSAQKIVITSYLDHPVGQMSAAYMAAKISDEPCGVLSHVVYKDTAFSEMIKHDGPNVKPTDGYGFGFDEQLSSLKFVSL